MPKILTFFIVAVLVCSGCARNTDGTWKAPFVYRVDVQQGNVVEQSMVNKLKPGMDKKQVRFIMGTPLLQDPFHSDRWDYIYSFEPGSGDREQRHIVLHFKDEKLSKITGDIQVTHAPINTEEEAKGKTVVVPLENYEEGFFDQLFSKSPEDEKKENETEKGEPGQTADEETVTGPVEDETQIEDEKTADTSEEAEEEAIPEIKKAEVKKEKGLIRRFWERMTSSEEDSTDENQETERDRRDAEVFEEAGGAL